MASQQSCRFLELHPELRIRIYEQVFADEVVDLQQPTTAPPILFTCEQIYNEAIGTYYNHSIFYTAGDAFKVDDAIARLARLSRNAQNVIRTVRVDTLERLWSTDDWCSLGGEEESQYLESWLADLKAAGIALPKATFYASLGTDWEEELDPGDGGLWKIWTDQPKDNPVILARFKRKGYEVWRGENGYLKCRKVESAS